MSFAKRGEIYWVSFDPTVGSEIQKQRPALVVSNDANNQYSSMITVLPMTSNVAKKYRFEVIVPSGNGGLTNASRVKTDQIRAIDKQRLSGSALGPCLDAELMAQVDAAIKVHLALQG